LRRRRRGSPEAERDNQQVHYKGTRVAKNALSLKGRKHTAGNRKCRSFAIGSLPSLGGQPGIDGSASGILVSKGKGICCLEPWLGAIMKQGRAPEVCHDPETAVRWLALHSCRCHCHSSLTLHLLPSAADTCHRKSHTKHQNSILEQAQCEDEGLAGQNAALYP
jgi:hypothetical protein